MIENSRIKLKKFAGKQNSNVTLLFCHCVNPVLCSLNAVYVFKLIQVYSIRSYVRCNFSFSSSYSHTYRMQSDVFGLPVSVFGYMCGDHLSNAVLVLARMFEFEFDLRVFWISINLFIFFRQ